MSNPVIVGSLSDSNDNPQYLGSLDGAPGIDELLPSQAGHSGEFLTTDGTNASWGAVASGTDLGKVLAVTIHNGRI